MGIFGNLFKRKKILSVKIISKDEGISEEDADMNYAVGHMMGGFNGVMHAQLLNENEASTTTFKITYNDRSVNYVEVKNGSALYNKYMRYIRLL